MTKTDEYAREANKKRMTGDIARAINERDAMKRQGKPAGRQMSPVELEQNGAAASPIIGFGPRVIYAVKLMVMVVETTRSPSRHSLINSEKQGYRAKNNESS